MSIVSIVVENYCVAFQRREDLLKIWKCLIPFPEVVLIFSKIFFDRLRWRQPHS